MVDSEATAAAVSDEAAGGAAADMDTSAPVSEEGAVAASSEESVSDRQSETETASFPSADDFGWDTWDGKSDTLPEQMRSWGDRFASHYEKHYKNHYQSEQAETQRLRSIYEALMEGQDDPRVGQMTEKLDALQKQFDELTATSTATSNEYWAYKNGIEQALEEEAQNYAAWFEKSYPQIFATPESAQKFSDLLEAGWELDYAPIVMELNDEALAIANKALTEGVPMSYAIELAQKSVPQPVKRTPRPGARITSGATGSLVSPNQAPKDALNEAKTLNDIRLVAAQRAYSKGTRS